MSKTTGIAKLAKSNFQKAFVEAKKFEDVTRRIQSLGWVARFAPEGELGRVFEAIQGSLGDTDDVYSDVMSMAWPVRAFLEKKQPEFARRALNMALEMVPQVSPTSSRAEAVGLLLHATLPAGIKTARPVIDTLLSYCSGDDHWRVQRAFSFAALLVNAQDPATAKKIASTMSDEKKKTKVLGRLEAGEQESPRRFFW